MADSISMKIRKDAEDKARLKAMEDTAKAVAELVESNQKLIAAVGLLSAKIDRIENEIAPKPTKAVR